jgi:ParB-like chromosome segregation protein Spo0J
MTVKKRGLGRGLETLLVDVPDNTTTQQSVIAQTLIETLQRENHNLLQEARALKELLNEFEAMVRQFGND